MLELLLLALSPQNPYLSNPGDVINGAPALSRQGGQQARRRLNPGFSSAVAGSLEELKGCELCSQAMDMDTRSNEWPGPNVPVRKRNAGRSAELILSEHHIWNQS